MGCLPMPCRCRFAQPNHVLSQPVQVLSGWRAWVQNTYRAGTCAVTSPVVFPQGTRQVQLLTQFPSHLRRAATGARPEARGKSLRSSGGGRSNQCKAKGRRGVKRLHRNACRQLSTRVQINAITPPVSSLVFNLNNEPSMRARAFELELELSCSFSTPYLIVISHQTVIVEANGDGLLVLQRQ